MNVYAKVIDTDYLSATFTPTVDSKADMSPERKVPKDKSGAVEEADTLGEGLEDVEE